MPMMCGGTSESKPATDEVQQICNKVKPKAEEHAAKTFDVFTAKEFKTQVVAGTNYFIKVKPKAEEHAAKTFDVFTAKEFKTQVVAGTNYFIKVHVGADEYLHLCVHRPLPYENKPLSLHSVQTSKTQHDEIVYF
ncbi:UNVERIFIED_CONTAM: hypothetical protein FKN15_002027 [Acipenser sinensis]